MKRLPAVKLRAICHLLDICVCEWEEDLAAPRLFSRVPTVQLELLEPVSFPRIDCDVRPYFGVLLGELGPLLGYLGKKTGTALSIQTEVFEDLVFELCG